MLVILEDEHLDCVKSAISIQNDRNVFEINTYYNFFF